MERYNIEIHHRRSIRLKDYDYSQEGAYFVTICTAEGKEIFGEVKNSQMYMTPQGEIASTIWSTLPQRFPGIELDSFVVMPNHVHGILVRTERFPPSTKEATTQSKMVNRQSNMRPYRTSLYRNQMLNEIVRTFKGATSYYVRCSHESMKGFGWHREFFERIIRNTKELDALREYIQNNPAKWELDKMHPQSGWKLR